MAEATIGTNEAVCNDEDYTGAVCLQSRLYEIWSKPSASGQPVLSPDERAARRKERRRRREREYRRVRELDEGYRQRKREWAQSWRKKNSEHVNAKRRVYRAKNKEKLALSVRRSREKARVDPARRMKMLISQCCARARQKNWASDRAFLAHFTEVPPLNCECCGRPFDFNVTGRTLTGPSFDRIDNTKGYVAGNVGVICYECNMIKNAGTLQQHEAIVAYMRRHLSG